MKIIIRKDYSWWLSDNPLEGDEIFGMREAILAILLGYAEPVEIYEEVDGESA